jgi:hypothetical protein
MNDRCLLCGQELRGTPSPEGARRAICTRWERREAESRCRMNDRCLMCGQELRGTPSPEGAAPDAVAGEAYDFPSPAVALLPVGPTSRRNDPSTSKVAAERALPHAGTTSWKVMQTIGTGALAYDEIAQRTGINPTTVSRRLTDICRRGLGVSLMPSPEHRAKRVKLTRAGLALLDGDSSLAQQVAA